MVQQYLEHSKKILTDRYSGYKPNRTGIDTLSRFGHQNEYDLSAGFPLITTKKVATRAITHELIWFMRGDTNIKYLVDHDVHIWDGNAFQHYLKKIGRAAELPLYSPQWHEAYSRYIDTIKNDSAFASEHGDLGPVYGSQWRKWKTSDGNVIDQLGDVVSILSKSPNSRRMIVSAWNPEDIPRMGLPPCHTLFHLNTLEGKLDCQLYQRSCDMFLGVPFNIASYAMLTHVLAQEAGLEVGRFIHSFGDAHFYCGSGARGAFYGTHLSELKQRVGSTQKSSDFLALREWIESEAPEESVGKEGQDHVTAILEQLSRDPLPLPRLEISKKPFDQLTIDDFTITNYQCHPAIKRSMAV